MNELAKTRKIKAYFAIKIKVEKPMTYMVRQFIHAETSGGFWCAMRDTTQSERASNSATAQSVGVVFYIGYNPEFLERWQELYIQDELGNVYRIKEKPDIFDYSRSNDIKFTGWKITDGNYYNEDRYSDETTGSADDGD